MALAHVTLADAPRGNILARLFAGFADAMINMAESNPRARAIREFQDKSDQELAELGMRREDIARHVFRDVYFL